MKTTLSMAVVGLTALLAASAALAQGRDSRIMATPVGSDSMGRIAPYPTGNNKPTSLDEKLALTVNKDEDRVGATYEICNDPERITCGHTTYVFPQLKVDKSQKAILLGENTIGHYGQGGVRLENGYQLRSETLQGETDTGFERYDSEHVKVFLEKTGE